MSKFELNINKLKRSQKGLYIIAQEDVADDINERINAVMGGYQAKCDKLQKENRELKRKLDLAVEALEGLPGKALKEIKGEQ